MNAVGIIAEYNPFHNGHLYHIEKAKEITESKYCVVIMSGNFVQRGDLAILDKYSRTEMALKNGADLVIELPVYFAASSAYYFSMASVSLLNSMGIVNSICFGSESGKVTDLKEIADFLSNEPETFKSLLKSELARGLSFPLARAKAVNLSGVKNSHLLVNPNNILAVEYLKALNLTNSKLIPYTVEREIAPYHAKKLTGAVSSATAIRECLMKGDFSSFENAVPKNTLEIWKREFALNHTPVSLEELNKILLYLISTKPPEELKTILDIDEGLENKLISTTTTNFKADDIIKGIKSKRYTRTKLQRALIHLLLNITEKDFNHYCNRGFAQYIRVLGFRKESSFLLKEIEAKGKLPMVTNLKNAKATLKKNAFKMLEKEIESTDIYLLARNRPFAKKYEYTKPLVII